MSDKEDYDARINRELEDLQAYHTALQQEFAHADPTDPDFQEKVVSRVVELVPDAGKTLKWLISHSESDSVRATCAKFVFTLALKLSEGADIDNDMGKLLKALQ